MQLIELTDFLNNRIVINPKNIYVLEEVITPFDSYSHSYKLIINNREVVLSICKSLSKIDNDKNTEYLHKKFLDIKEQMNRSIYE